MAGVMNDRTTNGVEKQAEPDRGADLVQDAQITDHHRGHGDREHQARGRDTLPVPPMAWMIPVFKPPGIPSLKWGNQNRL